MKRDKPQYTLKSKLIVQLMRWVTAWVNLFASAVSIITLDFISVIPADPRIFDKLLVEKEKPNARKNV